MYKYWKKAKILPYSQNHRKEERMNNKITHRIENQNFIAVKLKPNIKSFIFEICMPFFEL